MRKILLLVLTAMPLLLLAQDSVRIREQQLDEVVVSANSAQRRLQTVQIGAEQIQVKELTKAPTLFGEADIMRSIQLLPGVKSESDASSSFQVRGGTSAQNTILYDDVPVYNVGHLAGLFSAFNDNALAAATLYKGLIPAQFGGASSSVFDIAARTGRRDRWGGNLSVGLLSAKASVEGPVVKNKLNMLFNVRRSYADMFLKLSDDFKNNTLYFYDANLKLDYTIDDRNQLFLSFLASHDRMAVTDLVDLQWTNLAGSLSWLHHIDGRSTSQTTLLASSYGTDNGIDVLGTNISYFGHIRHFGLRQNFRILLGRHELNAGLQTMLDDVKSAEWTRVKNHEKEQRRAWDNAAWLGWQYEPLPRLALSAGLRLSAFSALGGPYYYDIDDQGNITWLYKRRSYRPVKTHVTLEPRFSLAWKTTDLLSLKAGYSRSSQNIHALRNQNTSTPFDRYAISSNLVKPEVADQVSLGLFAMTPSQHYDFSLEGYYRHVTDVLDYRDGISFSSAIEIERLVKSGEGRAYGVELCARKNSGPLTGWLAYTLSWSQTRIDGINGGRWYDANNDRRHDINIVASYRLGRAWTLGAVWVYNSGQAFTAPSAKYEMIDNYIYYYAERNGYRAPDYHHLDVSATWTKRIAGGRLTREWSFGIYNLYNRYNPYLIRFEDSQYGSGTKATQISLFGIVPSVALNIKW
ncbi:MAG: TonB-dependent receptor [Prevotella sp.]|nr:TonB-dependent receptor [Prevotella sp.]